MKLALILFALLLLFVLFPLIFLSLVLYRVLLTRTSRKKYDRSCSMPEDPEYKALFDQALAWRAEYADRIREVSIQSDGLRLAGEYLDFGHDKAVIIIPGRMESCLYSYYFAEPYRQMGYNILAIDNRSHGLSEGHRNSLGYKEYRDILRWGVFLHEQCTIRLVVMHGICIGASTALFALTSPDCPDYMAGLVGEGMFTTFSESFKNHMIEDHRPIFPLFQATMIQIRLLSGADVVHDGPLYRIDRLQKPLLMLHSREDVFSLPSQADALYARCSSEQKELVWFEHGAHSRIRVVDRDGYDGAIMRFLDRYMV